MFEKTPKPIHIRARTDNYFFILQNDCTNETHYLTRLSTTNRTTGYAHWYAIELEYTVTRQEVTQNGRSFLYCSGTVVERLQE